MNRHMSLRRKQPETTVYATVAEARHCDCVRVFVRERDAAAFAAFFRSSYGVDVIVVEIAKHSLLYDVFSS